MDLSTFKLNPRLGKKNEIFHIAGKSMPPPPQTAMPLKWSSTQPINLNKIPLILYDHHMVVANTSLFNIYSI